MLDQTIQLSLEIRDRLSESAPDLDRAAYNLAIHWYTEKGKAHIAFSAVKMHTAKTLSVVGCNSSVTFYYSYLG